MRYEINGSPLPVAICYLDPGETIVCEGGAMSWMSANMNMETTGGGIGKMFSKAFSGEKMFQNRYTAMHTPGEIAFASSFPGNILAVEIQPGRDIVCQKSAFLASTLGVELSIFFQKKLGAGFFGGEGFIMQRLSGNGLAFIEIDGSVIERQLGPGEQLIVDTGYVAMMDSTCSMDVQSVKGIKNMFLGGEGMFNTVITGPGKVYLQTMPASQVAASILPFIPTGGN
ncbi:MAG: TIGR00266 family protein [Lachnospiraceae bacterium]|nr:TIGR00266 family protein [Lachnospiraceae bacterium]